MAVLGPWASAEEVDLELVLAMDGSGSISDEEYLLQMEGTAAAFLDPGIQSAITSGPVGKIAVAVMIWADAHFLKINTGWYLLDSRQAAAGFADVVRNYHFTSPRKFGVGGGGGTGIGSGIGEALRMMDNNKFRGLRRVIDVSGDGVESDPGDEKYIRLPQARLLATARGVQINGLPILTKKYPRLDDYYSDHVITGNGSFIVVADGFEDFGRAILQKLDREITHRIADLDQEKTHETAGLSLNRMRACPC
ncbi:MAG: DUF1194 domain-containing protein [Pseudomonadota bacterium]